MEKRKTIGGEDIIYAMVTLGFENYAETLKIHLTKLRTVRTLTSQLFHCKIVTAITDKYKWNCKTRTVRKQRRGVNHPRRLLFIYRL